MKEVLEGPLYLGIFGGVFGVFLAIANYFLKVKEDPKVEIIAKILPGANCGACGFASCEAYAKALVQGDAEPGKCAPGGEAALEAINKILGLDVKLEKRVAFVRCQGGAVEKFRYRGIETCEASVIVGGGHIACPYGCLGFGDCVRACPFGAIFINENGVAEVDASKCTGCGICVEACPRKVIELVPARIEYYVACSSKDKLEVKKYCKNGCFGCGICASKKFNPDGVVEIVENLPIVHFDKVSSPQQLELAGSKCPVKAWKKISSGKAEKLKSEKVI